MTKSFASSAGLVPSWNYVSSRFLDDGVPGLIIVRERPRIALFIDAGARRFGGYFETDDPPALAPLATVRSARLDMEGRHCLELSVGEAPLFQSFYQLLTDLVARLLDGAPVGSAAQAVLDDWRTLLQQAAALNAERQAGLFGELWLLRRLIMTRGPQSVSGWTGPLRAAHDFRTAAGDLEVKTTYGARRIHVVNGMSQLTPVEDTPLYLLSLRLQAAGQVGLTLPDIIAVVRSMLIGASSSASQFERTLALAGYRDEDAELYPSRRRLADPALLVPIVDGCPRLPREALASLSSTYAPNRIVDVTYRIDVEGLGWSDGEPDFLAVLPATDENSTESPHV